MSSVVISGDTSGAVTLTVPAVSGTNTVTIAAQTGTLNAAGPAFSAYLSATQSFTANTFTKIQFNVEEFDTASCYDNVTNFRFTPNVAGYYQVSGMFTNATTPAGAGASVYKNGASYKRLFSTNGTANTSSAGGSCLVYLNGTTDYVELWGVTNSTQNAFAFADSTYFQASLVRGA